MKKYLIVPSTRGPFPSEPFWTDFHPKADALHEYVRDDFQAFLWKDDQFFFWNSKSASWEPVHSDMGLVQMTLVQMIDNA
jgi:hypothetical protein